MDTFVSIPMGKPVSREYRATALNNHVNYLKQLIKDDINSISLARYSFLTEKISQIEVKTKPNTKIMENNVTYEQVIVDDATYDNQNYYLDLAAEKKELEEKRNERLREEVNNPLNDEEYINSLFEATV